MYQGLAGEGVHWLSGPGLLAPSPAAPAVARVVRPGSILRGACGASLHKVLSRNVLRCSVLHCIVPHCIVLHCIVLRCYVLLCTVLHCISAPCVRLLQCASLHGLHWG